VDSVSGAKQRIANPENPPRAHDGKVIEMSMNEALHIASRSSIGRVRTRNEDCTGTAPEIGLVVLADGMGGYRGGEIASAIAVETVLRELKAAMRNITHSDPEPTKRGCGKSLLIRRAVLDANEAICRTAAAKPEYRAMGTTLVAALFRDSRIVVASVGDSRLYRLRAARLEQITVDHSLRQEMINRGICTPEEARVSLNKNLVTRALGIEATVAVDIYDHVVAPGDIYLLCSDGLSDMLSDDEISDILKRCDADLETTAEALIARANERGGRDNVSVILVGTNEPQATA
jgi:PPM family protein phosphatase